MTAEVAPMTDAEQAAPPSTTARSGHPTWMVVLPWTLAILAVAVAMFSALQWRTLADQQAQVDQARATAVAFVTDLTNWDAARGLDPVLDSLREQGTGPFLDEINEVFFGGDLGRELEDLQVSANGDIREAFVQSLANDRATVFVVVDVTYASPQQREPMQPMTFPAEVVLDRVDGQWFVRQVLVPNTEQIGRMMAPGGGS
jgi:hypothetical protein